ncbi:MAG: peptidylprolyl isomerase [Acidobacteria bacterium]|nr:peptidylprolyl isomerase [Acidobacteriota bacterium]
MIKQKFMLSAILLTGFSIATLPIMVTAQAIDQKDIGKSTRFPTLQRDRSAQVIYTRLRQMEDERGISSDFLQYLTNSHAGVRKQAVLTLGRIGDRSTVGPVGQVLLDDGNAKVREYAAFALGEIEDVRGVRVLIATVLSKGEQLEVRARAAEALGKIASMPENVALLGEETNERIVNVLNNILPKPAADLKIGHEHLVALTLTALMRIHSPNSIEPIAEQLASPNANIRFTAANSLARILRANPGKATKTVIDLALTALKDQNALVRATAANALGATKSADAVESLIILLNDNDIQVQASVIRALGSINDKKSVKPLIKLGQELLKNYREAKNPLNSELNQLYLIATTLGQLKDKEALPLLKDLRILPSGIIGGNVETETAIAQFGAEAFFDYDPINKLKKDFWQEAANFATGLGIIANERAIKALDELFAEKNLDVRAVPEILRAMQKAKFSNINNILREQLKAEDIIVRATAAELLMDSNLEEDFKALVMAFEKSSNDNMNDAKLAILMALAKFSTKANSILLGALKDPDHLVRRQAVDLLKMINAGNYEDKIGTLKLDRNRRFYEELTKQAGIEKVPVAEITTSKGKIRFELFAADAPLTVANFIALAQKGYFNNILFHRVVPNFVVQGGDPRGDGNGGPGHQIRCEINMRSYLRGSVGMALSGKDTGGSQFFICHSPQPHLDGGYTVFGQVISGMEVVDKIVRGDLIEKITIELPQ